MSRFEKKDMITARAANGEGFSAEIHRSGPSALSLPYRRWHVVSWYAQPCRMVRRMGGLREETEGAVGFTGVFPAGEGEEIEWLDPVEAVHLHLDPASLPGDAGQVRPMRRNPSDDGVLRHVMERLYRALDHSGARADADVVSLVNDVRHRLACDASEETIAERRIGAASLSDILDAMHGIPATDGSLASLAERARLSPDEFGRRFRAVFGTSPHDYLIVSRIEMAKHAILTGDKPIAQIALDCGFFDQAHFSNTFRRRAGMTVGAYCKLFGR